MREYRLEKGWRTRFKTSGPLSQAEAFIDLIENADEFGIIDKTVRELATSWRWSKSTAQDFLCALKKEELLASRTNSGQIKLVAPMTYVVAPGQNPEKVPYIGNTLTNSKTSIGKPIEQESCQKYRWAGAVIKLNETDYQKFQTRYHAIEDLDGLLATIDDEFAGNPKKNNQWFYVLGKKLNYQHQNALERKRNTASRQSSMAKIDKWQPV